MQASSDERIVDAALAVKFPRFLVLRRQSDLHLLEAVIMQFGGVDVIAGHRRSKVTGELEADPHAVFGETRII